MFFVLVCVTKMKITTNRICVFISLWAKLIVQCVSQKVLLTTIDGKCFTNTSSALAALYNLSDNRWQGSGEVPSRFTGVKYVPENSKKLCEKLDCFYSGNVWKIKNSLEPGPIDNLVIDRRWEDFPMYVTKHVDEHYVAMQYLQVGIINSADFVIPFSLHSQYEAHVLLCDNTPVRPSRCYWLMLQAWKNTKTAFRTCERYEIQEIYDGKGPKGRCSKSTTEKTDVLNIFSEDKWSHFKITKTENELQFVDEKGNILFEEKVEDIAPRYVFIHSKVVNGLWKIHNFNYFYSESLGITYYYMKVTAGQQCLSMFIAMCKFCSLTIELLNYNIINQEYQLGYKNFNNKIETWQDAIFCVDIPKKDLYLRVTNTLNARYGNKAFWALSDIRTGKKDEFRYLAPDSNIWTGKCQSLKSGSVLDNNAQKIEILESWNVCKEDQFGEDCFPCNQFNHEACSNRTKYCQLVNDASGNVTPKCYCSIGYQESDCQELCSGNTYGHSCQRSCKNCQYGCKKDTKFGKCNPPGYCSDNYFGDKCDIPFGIFLFANAPKIEAGFTECQLTQTSFDGKGDSSNVKFYKFQFRENVEGEWIDVMDKPLQYNFMETVTLGHLKSETTYQVRVFGYGKLDDLKQLSHLKESIKVYYCTTQCKNLDENHVIISSDSTSVNVSIKTEDFEHLCSIISITVNDTEMERKDKYFTKDNLEPYSLYRLSVRNKFGELFGRSFRTMEAAPTEVRDFRHEKHANNSIDLYWKKPEKTNGQLLFYTISKLLTNRKACTDTIPLSNTTLYADADADSITLWLRPYSKYELTIKANTSAGFGEPSMITLETDPIANITSEEIPQLHENGITSTSITFSEVSCQKIWGPMTINIRIEGKDTWCTHKVFDEYHNPSIAHEIKNLKPFCNYAMTLDYIRDKYHNEEIMDFTTKEAAPYSIDKTNFLVTSKGSDHISMRWLPPNPPTGHLEKYQIKISKSTRVRIWTKFEPAKLTHYLPQACKLWSKYHCVTIRDLEKNYVYNLEISSKNKGYDGYSLAIEDKVQAIEKEPGKPFGLNVSWTDENYLSIQWGHPLQTLGVLKGFQIIVNSQEMPGYEIGSEDDYLPTYSVTIKENLDFPKNYKVEIKSQNPAGSSEPNVLSDIKSPPPIPNYSVETKRNGNSVTITLKEINKYYSKAFERFLYVLISDCTTCQDRIVEFQEKLMVHHQSSHHQFNDHPSRWRLSTFDFYEEPWNEEREIVIATTEQENVMNNTYSLGFIWIYRHEEFVRSNLTIEISDVEKKKLHDPTVVAGAIIAVIVLVLIIVATVFGIKRFREGVLKNTTGMFASNAHIIDARARDLNEPIYENQQDISLNEILTRRRTLRNRPFSVLITDEICPGVPTFQTDHSRRIKLETFYDYVKNAIESGELKIQHDTFPRGKTKEWAYGINPENMPKNRYQNLIAYDHSRVVLNKINGDEYSDYINANYIDGYRHPKAYIATQGPKKQTVADFWRMIWQERVTHIVMMANVIEGNKKKTEQYWPPNVNDEVTFGDYKIAFVSAEIHADYDFRSFEVRQKYSKPRQVRQLHFKVWPDHGVPLYAQSLVPFLHRLLTLRSTDFPLVVHCSAGVGRTGTIILCDICLRMAAAEGYIDAFAMLEHLRNQRPNMVDNVEQYKLAHLVILNCLMGLRTNIAINADFQGTVEKVNMVSELNYIRSCEWQDDAMKTVAFAYELEVPVVPEKNRFSTILPDKAARVILHPYPPNGDNSTYINAVHVDGYCQPSRYVVTQFPLPNTIGDFWRLVVEKRISVIVCLNEVPARDQTCEVFWPKKETAIQPEEVVHVEHVKDKNVQGYNVMTFKLSTFYGYQEKETRKVEIIKFNGWKYPAPSPDYNDFVSFVEEVTNVSRNSEQVLVTCYDGATASGLFIAMSFLMELIKLEQQLDVCQAVRSIRTSRKEFVNSKEQLQFLYKASLMYIEGRFAQYSNINFQQ